MKLALDTFGATFDHLLVICQPPFLKYVVDKEILKREHLEKTFLLLGGTWFADSFFDFVEGRTGEPRAKLMTRTLSFYGIAEAGMGIGIQTPALAATRHCLSQSISSEVSPAPQLCAISSERFFVESLGGKLFITALSKQGFPLLRYASGDSGFLTTADGTGDVAKSPALIALEGRLPENWPQYPILENRVEDVLNRNYRFSSTLTGNFRISKTGLTFETKLKSDHDPQFASKLQSALGVSCPVALVQRLEIGPYNDADLLRKPYSYA